MSIWRSLSDLERWAEGHYAHLMSYVRSVQHGTRHGASAKLSRYHEVLVPTSDQIQMEYRNCHGKTGVLEIAIS
jgi:aldoxime dehydratase